MYSFFIGGRVFKSSKTYPQIDANYMCDISIPNKEFACVYEKEVLNRTNQNHTSTAGIPW